MLGYEINPYLATVSPPKTQIKNICVPFNFSRSAYVGLKYAVGFAKLINAEVTILNCFQSTVLSFGSAEDVAHSTAVYERKEEIIKKIPQVLEVPTRLLVEHAYLSEMTDKLCEHKKVDMVIMGSEISAKREKLLGSNASSLVNYIDVPLLIVPDDLKRIKMDHIMFAVDYKDFEELKGMETLKALAEIFRAKVHIVHISDHDISQDQVKTEKKLETCFNGMDHRFYQYHYSNIHEGLKDFAKLQAIDLITMMPRKHGFVERLYRPSQTKKMALDTKVPLLVLHE